MSVDIQVSYEDHEVHLQNTTLTEVAAVLEKKDKRMASQLILVHRKSVQQILTLLINLCNVMTGRLRGGFTPLLDQWGLSASYQRVISKKALGEGSKPGGQEDFSQAAVEAGKAEGQFIDEPMNTTIINNVFYGVYVDRKTGLIVRATDRGSQIYQHNFENFLEAAAAQDGAAPDPDPGEAGPDA